MRTYVVAALVVAVVACLTLGVSAGGYGYGHKGQSVYQHYRPPRYAYRYIRQPYLLNGNSGFGQQYISGYNSGGFSGYRGGFYNRSGGGLSIIWWLLIAVVLFAILADK